MQNALQQRSINIATKARWRLLDAPEPGAKFTQRVIRCEHR